LKKTLFHIIAFENNDKNISNDRRIQIEFTDTSDMFSAINDALIEAKFVDSFNEYIMEPSIIIGGTIAQPPHCDIARVSCTYTDDNDVPIADGHEVNRLQFNKMMKERFAPCTL
jgi:hypothetical protein